MLAKVGLLTAQEATALVEVLNELKLAAQNGAFTIEAEHEDMHSKIEHVLTQRLGDVGKKIHTARSRNDQVLVAMHLYVKHELVDIKAQVTELFDLLLTLAEKHKNDLIPGYTHLQVAMPSSIGLWLSAYAESLVDDLYAWQSAYKIADQNPLGSAAGYGSAFPIDRVQTTEALGFATQSQCRGGPNEPRQIGKKHRQRLGEYWQYLGEIVYGHLPLYGAGF